MAHPLSIIDELRELGLNGTALDGIATASAATLQHAKEIAECPHPSGQEHSRCFETIRRAIDTQVSEIGRASGNLPISGLKSPVTSNALERINIALNSTAGHDRRSVPRYQLSALCRVEADGDEHDMRCLDISARGIRLHNPAGVSLGLGTTVTVHVHKLGSMNCTVRNKGRHGLNLEFCLPLNPVGRAVLAGILLELSAQQDMLICRARDFALALEGLFSKAIPDGMVAEDDLFDTSYQTIPGTSPVQGVTRATAFYDEALPPLLAKYFRQYRDVVYAVATDRNGHVPVHNTPFSRPQRHGDPEFNLAFARNRRIYHDVPTLRAARFSSEAMVQVYPRDLGNHPDALVTMASAPVFVRGRRWGCAEIAFSIRQ